MAATSHVRAISHVATPLGADPDLLDAIVSVQIGREEYLTTITEEGIDERRDMLLAARISVEEWHRFLENFVGEPDIIARVKDLPPR